MAKQAEGVEALMNMWQEGQTAFLKAQKEAMDSFSKALSSSPQPSVLPEMGDGFGAWQDFIKSWAPTWDPSSMMANGFDPKTFTSGNDQFFAMLDSSNWIQHAPEQLRSILQTIASGPRFADLAMPQMDAADAWREVLDYQKATGDFTRALQGAWGTAFESYSKNFSLEDLQSPNPEDALDAWLKAANESLLDVQRTPEFMDAQRRMVRAATEIKARQAEMAEAWSEAYQIPTRTEMDDLIKIVHELRREVRKLKREVGSRN